MAHVPVSAGGADRDVTEIRGFREQNNRVLNAMRVDLNDLGSPVDRGFAEVDRGFAEMHGTFDATAAEQQQISDLLHTIIERSGETPHGS